MKQFITSPSCSGRLRLAVSVLLWLFAWQAACLAVGETLLLPAPFETFARMVSLMFTHTFWQITMHSILRIVWGYLLGVVTGTLLACLTALVPISREFISLPMHLMKTTPVASFIILALIWLNSDTLSTFIAFLMVLPLVWNHIEKGFLTVDDKLLEIAQVYKLSLFTKLRFIILPALSPFFLSACQTALGFAWKAGIAGEVIAIPKNAIGTQLYNAKIYLDTTDLFAWTGFVILLSYLIEQIVVLIIRFIPGGRYGKHPCQ